MGTNVAAPGGNQEQSISLLNKVPFGAIIGGPLKAAVEAQAAAAVACADFIQKIGFDPILDSAGKPTGQSSIKNITFTFERQVPPPQAGGTPTTARFTLTVPLLSIMPLPFIRIESLTVNFKVAISAIDERSATERNAVDAEGKLEGSVGFAMWKVGVSGSVSSKKSTRSRRSVETAPGTRSGRPPRSVGTSRCKGPAPRSEARQHL